MIFKNVFQKSKNSRELNNHSKNSFTLIELLVVIAIIGLLASITLESLKGAMARARDVRRISELQQLRRAILLYYENNNKMPINRKPGWGYCDNQPNFLQ